MPAYLFLSHVKLVILFTYYVPMSFGLKTFVFIEKCLLTGILQIVMRNISQVTGISNFQPTGYA